MKTGGSAFPQAVATGLARSDGDGMSLRDYFAGLALPEAIAAQVKHHHGLINPPAFDYALVARSVYAMADAMLEARER